MSPLDRESRAFVRPTGTVTFLFSDIEGSTERWERARHEMDAALRRHDATMRRAIEAHGGLVFKTVGDEFCSSFTNAKDALVAALDAQRALAAENFNDVGGIRVRMALHAGVAYERDGDYFGPAVNRVARLLSAGHGGQILVSSVVADLLQGEMPPHTNLRDLGAHRLKDLAPEHIHQVVAADLPDAFPALLSVDVLPNNLPLKLTSFIGRESEVREIKALLRDNRLVTLTGAGGAGKTRCATQAGAELLEDFDDGVWLVELAPISDPSLIPGAIAQALNLQPLPSKPVFDTVLHYLKRRHALLILDNCEHLIQDASNAITLILEACPEVRILVTSRERLNIAGESVFRMPSLPVPPLDPALPADEMLQYAATALFTARAGAADSRFTLTNDNAPAVAEICRRIDGIPLAIELAAARIKVLSPSQLAQKLDDRFRLLTGGDRAALPRQQTMRALIDWSYGLLNAQESTLFRKLSIFSGGFTLALAQNVCSDETLDEIAVLDVLTSLVDKSLVDTEPVEGETRFRLLESTRQYAREKLVDSKAYDSTARAHAAGCLALAESLEDVNKTCDRVWAAKAEPELDNWRAALEWTLGARNDVLLGQRLVIATRRTWSNVGASEGLRWLRLAMEHIDASTPAPMTADLNQTEAALDGVLGLHKPSFDAAERAIEQYRALGDSIGVAKARRQAGRSLVLLGRFSEGDAILHEALETFRDAGDRALIGATLENLAIARGAVGDITDARAFFEEALRNFKEIGADRLAAAVESNLAESEFHAGNPLEALRLAREALNFYGTSAIAHRRALLLSNVAAYLIALRRFDEARGRSREALIMARSLDYAAVKVWAMQHLAAIASQISHGSPKVTLAARSRAAQLLAYVEAQVSTLQMKREFTENHEYEFACAALREQLNQSDISNLGVIARKWTEEQAVAEALLV